MAMPANLAIYGIPATTPYFPSSMQQNTIPLEDVEGTINCLEWLNTNMSENSCLLAHHAFVSWAQLHLNKNHTIVYYAMNLTKAVEVAQANGLREIYLIWWYPGIGWYPSIRIPENFKLTYGNGRIGIYLHV